MRKGVGSGRTWPDPPGQRHGSSQSAQSPATSMQRRQGLEEVEAAEQWLRTALVTALSPLPARLGPHAPHRLRSSASSRSLAWLADSRLCKNARASFQAAWPRPMKLLRVGYVGQRGQTAHGRGPRTARTFSPPLELGKASPPPPRPRSAHDRQSLGATIGGAAGDTGPCVPLKGAAFLPRKHSLRLWGLGPHTPPSGGS